MGFSEEVMICRTPAASSKNHGLVALTVCRDVSVVKDYSWNRREHPLPHLGKAPHGSVALWSGALECSTGGFVGIVLTSACPTCAGQRELP